MLEHLSARHLGRGPVKEWCIVPLPTAEQDRLILNACYRWLYVGNRQHIASGPPARCLLNAVPDFMVRAELRSKNVLVYTRIRVLLGKQLLEE